MIYLYAMLGGILSGILNTLASSGSAVTLPLLVWLAVSPTMANATNRLGIVSGALTSTLVFHRKGLIDWKRALPVAFWVLLGAVLGASKASTVGDGATKIAITVAVVLALMLILVGSKRFLRPTQGPPLPLDWSRALLLTAIGVWAGFIVLDSATYLLLALVVGLNYDLTRANALKSLCLLSIASVSVLVFALHQEVDWGIGSVLAVGNVLGSWGAAHFATHKDSGKWVYRLLVGIVSLETVKLAWEMT